MLSSTSLLHGNCIFNRNNTVATQQGMKTYWLCKSYRITMCRARCITHQGRVISATGMHNHQPHMKGSYPNTDFIQSGNGTSVSSNGNSISVSMRLPSVILPSMSSAAPQNIQSETSPPPQNSNFLTQHQESQQSQHPLTDSQSQEPTSHATLNIQHSPSTHHNEHATPSVDSSPVQHNHSNISVQNMMQHVLSPNNLMHLTNMTTILNPMLGQPQLSHPDSVHHSNDLQVAPSQGIESVESLNSSPSTRSSMQNAQLLRHHVTTDLNRTASHHSMHASHQHHQHHQSTQSNENSSTTAVLSPPINPSAHQSQPPSESDPSAHHSLRNELSGSSSFKIEQM